MSQSGSMTPAAWAAAAFEAAVLLAGLGLTWRLVLSRRGREASGPRLAEWALPPVDFACFLAFAFVGAMTVSAAAGLIVRPFHLGDETSMVAGSAVMHVGILLGLAGFYVTYGLRARGAAINAPAAGALRSGLATFLIAMPPVIAADLAWGFILRRMGMPEEQQDLVSILENSRSIALKLSLLAVATLLVPVTEEVIFRGALFRYFRTRAPRWLAITLTSALFGALHVSWGDHMAGLPSLAPLFVLAVVFCLAYERTGNIGTTIVAHALFNMNMFVLVVAGVG